MTRLLVVTGEGSGDAFAAPVVARLRTETFGLGGPQLAAAGTELVASFDSLGVMGITAPLRRAPRLARALVALVRAVRRERPRAALLVGFSEVNARLAPWLRSRGTQVLWYAPPQVWAWRPHRARSFAARCDRFAVVLPFEESLWQKAGAHVDYVGHPALDEPLLASVAESALPNSGKHPSDTPLKVALLPGSRSQEVRAHLERFVGAALKLRQRLPGVRKTLDVTVVRAPSLDPATARYVEETARRADLAVTGAPLHLALAGRDVAVAASGTATLECAVLAVPPVIVYRTDALTHAIAKRLVRVPHIGLPNLVLGRGAFPELIQGAATEDAIADAATAVLDRRASYLAECHAVKRALEAGLDARTPSARVADLLAPWLR